HLRSEAAGIEHLEVHHFHELCVELAKEAAISVREPTGSGDQDYFDHALPEALAEAAERLGPRFDAVVVDEAQDFKEWWWPAVLALHRHPDDGYLYVFADANQNLYGGALPIPPEEQVGPIGHNLRNTKEIAEFVSVFYDGVDRFLSQGPDGSPVEVLGYEDDDGLFRLATTVLTNLVEEEHVPLEDIALLTPSGKDKSRLRS